VYDGIPHQIKQRAGYRGITAEDMEKSQHTDFNEDAHLYSIDQQQYADDTQLFISLSPSDYMPDLDNLTLY